MTTVQTVLNGSQWLNNKTGDRYTVIAVLNDLNGNKFVVYQLAHKEPPTLFKFAVKHSENGSIGECMLFPVEDGLEGLVSFETDSGCLEGIVDAATALECWTVYENDLPWCRPFEMWHQKFTAIADKELKTV